MAAEVTWVGHATVLVRAGAVRLLTDPVLTDRLAHLRRRTAAVDPDVLRTDVVLVSHAHADHLHRRSLRRLAAVSPEAVVVVPRGAAPFVAGTGLEHVVEVEAGQTLEVAGVRLQVTHAEHSARRSRVDSREAPPVGFVVEHEGRRLWFAGDTDLYPAMAEIGPVDLTTLPISGWWRTLGPGHLDEARAAEAVALVRAARVLPIHWGTFSPEDLRGGTPQWHVDTGRRFEQELSDRGLLDRLVRLEPGQTTTW